MKKFIGVLVAVVMCASLCVPAAMAASTDDTLSQLQGLLGDTDLSALTDSQLTELLGSLDLENIDMSAITDKISALTSSDSGSDSVASGIEAAADDLEANLGEVDAESEVSDALSSALGNVDMSWLTDLLGDFDIKETVDDALSGVTGDNSGDFVSTIESFFSGLGLDSLDLSSADLGNFDISSVLGSLDTSSVLGDNSSGDTSTGGATDVMAGLADKLISGLKALGVDTSVIEGILGSDLVNFFANMYIGFIGAVDEPTTEAETSTEATTAAVEASTAPKTGDSGSVLAAIATLSVAAAAAFVCTKKKRA